MAGMSANRTSRWPLYVIVLVMVLVVMSAQAPELLIALMAVIAIASLTILAYYYHASRTPYARFFGKVLVEDDPRDLFEPRGNGARKVRKRP